MPGQHNQDNLQDKDPRQVRQEITASVPDSVEVIPGVLALGKNCSGALRLVAPVKETARIKTENGTPNSVPEVDVDVTVSESQTGNDGEFFRARFRALSKIYIEDYCVDFSKDDVLQKSTPLLARQTVYKNHWVWDVEDWVGVVEKSMWDGASNPPGIDADIKIDVAMNERIVRGLEIGAIHSASVTTFFRWSQSHQDMDGDTFLELLGEEIDGEIVRVIVDEIVQFGELSLVWQGADPYAKRKLGARDRAHAEFLSKQGGNNMTNEDQIKKLQGEVAELTKQLGDANEEVQELTNKVDDLSDDAKLGTKYREEVLARCEAHYRLIKGEAAKQEFIDKMIKNAPFENVLVLDKEYEEELDSGMAFTCPHCGKQIAGLRASKEASADGDAEEPSDDEVEKHKVS